jgi:alkylation response protein AidB-like acyl-CoA dehydrogenase
MDLAFGGEEERFRDEVRTWLHEHLVGDLLRLRGRGGLGDMDAFVEERIGWERLLAEGGWTGLAWPTEVGGRGASLFQQVIFHEEYARARAPGRVGHIGENLLGPTVIAFGTEAQKQRFLPPILAGQELWCQGYSEPNAGSDLAGLQTRAVRDGDTWVITGQKVWTSLASFSQWCFVLARTDPEAPRHQGISCLLVPMDQPGIQVVPIRQMTGNAEFAEVFFEEARCPADAVVGPVNAGWKVAMATLAFERGASTLGQQLEFAHELREIVARARQTGRHRDPVVRQRIAEIWMRLEVMRHNSLRLLTSHEAGGELPREATIGKLYWASLHRDMGELAMDVLGEEAAVLDDAEHSPLHRLFLWARSDTIYAGTNQIQRNLIAQRALGLPR